MTRTILETTLRASALASCWAGLALLALARSSAAETSPGAHLQIFLLIGQSNMSGRGPIEPRDRVPVPRVFKLTQALGWEPAADPLHFDKPAIVGVGPGLSFARCLTERDPNIEIGLVPAAVGGTSLDEWAPGGKLYTDAVMRAQAALKRGTLGGILWHQGEADSPPAKAATYARRFQHLIEQLALN